MSGGIALCIPSSGREVCVEWGLSIAALVWPMNTTVHYFLQKEKPVEMAREHLIEDALKREPSYILFLDDDVIPPRECVKIMLNHLAQDPQAMVISGVYVSKDVAPCPLIFRKNGDGPAWDWKMGDVFEIEGCGAGIMLIKAEIFKKLPKPWFAWTNEYVDADHNMTVGEDIHFCNRVREAGYKVLADGGVICIHYDSVSKLYYTLPPDSYPVREDLAEAKCSTS